MKIIMTESYRYKGSTLQSERIVKDIKQSWIKLKEDWVSV